MYCKNCGSEVSPNEKYCHSCGYPIAEEVSSVNGNPTDSKDTVKKKSSGLKKSSKIIIASVLAVVLLSGIAAACIRLGVKMANKPAENGGSASASDSDDVSSQNGSQSSNKIRTFNSLLEDDNYWVPVKVERIKHYSEDSNDFIIEYKYDWYENEVEIEETQNPYSSNPSSAFYSVAFDNDGKILSEKINNGFSDDITYEYENGLLSKIDYTDIIRDSNGKITKMVLGSSTGVEFKYNAKNECGICVSYDSKPLFSAVYKYDNNDGISLNLTDLEILDKEWAEEDGVYPFYSSIETQVEPYPVISLDKNDAGMITRFSIHSESDYFDDNYLCKTTENGYYSEYKISYDYGYVTYKVQWERGTKAQERTGLYEVFTEEVVLDFLGEDISYFPLLCFSILFASGESVF